MTIIKVRRGINGFRYSACDENGYFIGNFEKLADVRQHWKLEIKWGQVVLIRELDKQPDMAKIEATKKAIEHILKSYAGRKKEKMMCKVIRFEAAVRQSKTIRIICSEDFPKAKAVSTLGIYSNQGNPAACVRAGGNDYIFPLENGFQIFEFNEFLKSLNLGLKIQFINYKQYAELVAVCNQMIQKRNSGNPVILLR